MKAAPCAIGGDCPAEPATNFDVVLGEGTSQSGRFLRDFLYRGFNKAADGKPVFDGVLAIIAGGRRTWTAVRFAQQGRWSRQHEDHFMQGDQFPFSYATFTDPVSGRTDGLLKRCEASRTCPKLMQIDGSFEWWGGRGSLNVTDGAGRDVQLPPNVRYYFVPGTQHGGGGGVTTGLVKLPDGGSICRFANSPVTMTPIERALVVALEDWVVHGKQPPASAHPRVADGSATKPAPVPLVGTGKVSALFVTDHVDGIPRVQLDKLYQQRVPAVNADGNETAGIATPEVTVPLATYLGWNVRGAGHAEGQGCSSAGATIPFAIDAATKPANDPRAPLSERYTGRADFLAKFNAATEALVRQGLLLPLDAEHIYRANAGKVSPQLLP